MKKLEFMTEPELAALMRAMAGGLEFICRHEGVEPPHFVLLLFDDPKMTQYIANCERGSVVEALREAAERLGSGQDVTR